MHADFRLITMKQLTPSEIKSALTSVPAWSRRRNAIQRTFEFRDFVTAIKFVNAVARAAEKAEHHPDIDIRWNRVTLVLSTHDAGGLTELDFAMERRCEALALEGPPEADVRINQAKDIHHVGSSEGKDGLLTMVAEMFRVRVISSRFGPAKLAVSSQPIA